MMVLKADMEYFWHRVQKGKGSGPYDEIKVEREALMTLLIEYTNLVKAAKATTEPTE